MCEAHEVKEQVHMNINGTTYKFILIPTAVSTLLYVLYQVP
jgi:hypothetical protein